MARRHRVWIPASVKKVSAIIELFIDTHPAGFSILAGKSPWPQKDELVEWITAVNASNSADLGVRVSGGPLVFQPERKAEAADSVERKFSILDKYGGPACINKIFSEYANTCPENMQILAQLSKLGYAGAKTMEAIAGEHFMDVKTLRNLKKRVIEDISIGIVYSVDAFHLG